MKIPYAIRRWTEYAEWRFLFRRVRGFFVRGWQGWTDLDTWSLDAYISKILAGGLRHLAENKHGCPSDFYELHGEAGHELWAQWLLEKAGWFKWYADDSDGTLGDTNWIDSDLSEEERIRRIKAHQTKMTQFNNVVLPDFVKYFAHLWD